MVFAKIRQNKGNHTESLFCANGDLEELKQILDITVLRVLYFEINGRNYKERKNSLRDLAIDFQIANDGDTDVQLSLGEIGAACDYFERMGKRYGLLREYQKSKHSDIDTRMMARDIDDLLTAQFPDYCPALGKRI